MTRPSYRLDTECWFIGENGRWFRVRIAKREPKFLTIEALTGWDAERQVEWPHPDGLRFYNQSTLYKRLRPAGAREP